MSRKTTSNTRENPKLLLSKAINALATKQDAFIKAVESMEELKREEIVKYDLEIEAKQEELDKLEEQFKHKLKNKQIETDQQISEYQYEQAIKILKEREELPVGTAEFQRMKEELTHLRSDIDKRVTDAVAIEKAEGKRSMQAAINNATLTHKADTAVLTATVDQLKKQIETLEAANEKLNGEIKAQRELTEAVANAGRAAPITQQIGKA
jgi:polyhydroxyalkanoate synthesis regulator phasin